MKKEEQLDFLIQKLNPTADIPPQINDKFRLFRSLVNVREPVPVDDDFLSYIFRRSITLIVCRNNEKARKTRTSRDGKNNRCF